MPVYRSGLPPVDACGRRLKSTVGEGEFAPLFRDATERENVATPTL
jgi:hypothetical protein